MSKERWQQIWKLFEEALERPSEERAAFLDTACSDDSALRREVASFLEAHEQRGAVDDLGELFQALPAESSGIEGRMVAQYQILERVGRGGMGVVYKARDTRLNRVVALKFLPPHLSTDPRAKERFLVEARAAAMLEHPNICTIHEIGETATLAGAGSQLFIVMPCYEGQTLKERLEQGSLSVEEALEITLQVAEGLAHAHAQGVVHRDIKPANVMLVEQGILKVLDFGLAKMQGIELTQAGARMGTVAYMSPQQARGEAIDTRTDLWSLGVMLYEMLSGQRPFRGEYEQAIIYNILNQDPRLLRQLQPDVPAALGALVEKALAKQPEQRQEDVAAFIKALEQVRRPGAAQDSLTEAKATVTVAAAQERHLLPEGERLQTTIVVSQVDGYFEMVEQLAPEEVEQVMARLHTVVREVAAQHNGVIHAFGGEAFSLLFGVPTTHEDDAVLAVQAAWELHGWVREISPDVERRTGEALRLRTGIDTGLVLAQRSGQDFQVTGATLQRANRLSGHADVDEVFVSPKSRRLVAPYFETEAADPIRLKGKKQRITPHRIVGASGLESRLEAAERAGLTTYTGREKELQTLHRCLDAAQAGKGQFVTVTGEAGIGKSRLLYEFRHTLKEGAVAVLQGRCQSSGTEVAYLPFIEALKQYLGAAAARPTYTAEAIAERIRSIDASLEGFIPLYLHVLSIEGEAYPLPQHLQGDLLRVALLQALAAFFTLIARPQPLVLFLEDWHWADAASRDILEQLAELVASYPCLLVVTYRSVFKQDWGAHGHHTALRLRALEEKASLEMIREKLGVSAFPEELGALLHARTGGNPFFLEEICQTLLEEGVLRIEEEQVVLARSMEELHLPDTVQAVIRTRLHRLDRAARAVLRLAAVVGREFSRGILQHILGDQYALQQALEELRRAGLIQQTRVFPEATYLFKHILMQEVAYDSLLQHQRKKRHREVGEAMEALYPSRTDEQLEQLAHHFSLAEDWRKGVFYGREAGRRAMLMGHYSSVVDLFQQVYRWLLKLPEDRWRIETQIDVYLQEENCHDFLGERKRQQEIIDDVHLLLKKIQDPRRLTEVNIRQGDLNILLQQYNEAEHVLEQALQLSRDQADGALERKTLRSLGFLRWHQGEYGEAVAINKELVALSRKLNHPATLVSDISNLIYSLRGWGKEDDTNVEAIALQIKDYVEELSMISSQVEDRLIAQIAWFQVGDFYRLMGDNEKGILYIKRSLDKAIANHHLAQMHMTVLVLSHLYFEIEDLEQGINVIKEIIIIFRQTGYTFGLPHLLYHLGTIYLGADRNEEARTALREVADLLKKIKGLEAGLPLWVSPSQEPLIAWQGYHKSLNLFHEGAIEAVIWTKLATACERMEDTDGAGEAWEKARILHQVVGNGKAEGEALEGQGRAARRQHKLEEALSYYREALDLAEQLEDPKQQGDLHNTIGILYWQQQRYQDALSHYEQALTLFQDLADDIHAGLMYNNIGLMHHKLGQSAMALANLEKGLVLHRRTGQQLLEAHAHTTMGDVYLEDKQFAAAQTCYGASLQLRWDLADHAGEGWMLYKLAQVYQQNEVARARDSLTQALQIAGEVADRRLLEACKALEI